MHKRSALPLVAISTAAIALGLSLSPGLAAEDTPSKEKANEALQEPQKNDPVTPAEVSECMKSWDPQTQMSKEEYEKSCQRTLKYFPENP
jgi:hypothetical protein